MMGKAATVTIRRRSAAPCRRCGHTAFEQGASLCCQFAALFDGCFDGSSRRRNGAKEDACDTFLITLKAIEDGGADLVRVYGVLRAARRRQNADHGEYEHVQIRGKRARISRLKARLERDLRELIALHDTINPNRFPGHPKFPTAGTYEETVAGFRNDIVFQMAGADRPVGPPVRPWLAETRQFLRDAGVRVTDANDLLRQLGMLPPDRTAV